MGKAALLFRPSVTNQQINTIAVDETRFNAEFVYYDLSVRQQELKAAASGSATPILNKGHFSAFEISVPPIATQNKIAEILGILDDKIDLNRRINQTLEAMAQALFKSWFVDFDPVKAKLAAKAEGRDPIRAAMNAISGKVDTELDALPPEVFDQLAATAALFPDEMEESALGEIPRGWKARSVGDFAELKGGKQLDKTKISPSGVIPVFGGAGIMGYTNKHNADGFVISVGRVGAYCGQFFSHRGHAWINNNASLIKPRRTEDAEWLFFSLKNMDVEPIKKGAAQPFVSNGDIEGLPLIEPSNSVVSRFTRLVTPMLLQQEKLSEQASQLANLRDALLPKLLSGELSVTQTMAQVNA
ncbi:MAG: hypothetical protein RIS44_1327 [Pseudomonadota bacterium]